MDKVATVGPAAADRVPAERPKAAGVPIAGGVLAGIAGSVCCVGPLALVSVGVGGAWVSNLTAMQPWSPVFVALAVLAFGFAAYKLFYVPKVCAPGTPCADPRTLRNQRVIFAIAVPLVAALLSFPLYAKWFY
ncbi:MAG: mercuric transporter MerT family protein [Burkholderiales bacterium]